MDQGGHGGANWNGEGASRSAEVVSMVGAVVAPFWNGVLGVIVLPRSVLKETCKSQASGESSALRVDPAFYLPFAFVSRGGYNTV